MFINLREVYWSTEHNLKPTNGEENSLYLMID